MPFEGKTGNDIKALYIEHNGLNSDHKVTSDAVFSKEWGPWESGAFEINEKLRARIMHFIDMAVDSHNGYNIFVQTHVDWIREAFRLFTDAPDTEDYEVTTKTILTLQFDVDKKCIRAEREAMPNR